METGTLKKNRLMQTAQAVFLMLFAFPLLPLHWTNALFMLSAACTLTLYFMKPVPIGKIFLNNLFFILPFIPYLFEFIVTGFEPVAHFQFEKKIFFFTAPLIVPVFLKVGRFNHYKLALLIFSLSVCLLGLYAFSVLILKGMPFSADAYKNGSYLLRHEFEKLTHLHSTVFSAYALAASVFLFMFPAKRKTWQWILRILAVFMCLSALYLAVRIAFITAFVLGLIFIINADLTLQRKIILSVFLIIAMSALAFITPSINSRLSEFAGIKGSTTDNFNTISQRKTITSCSWQVFTMYMFSGTGCSHFQEELNACYESKGWSEGAENNFNPHNQYILMGINYGILILITFLLCLFMIFRKIIRLHEGRYFVVIILLFFMTESLLEKQMGVYFFGLLSLLMYNVTTETVENQ